MKVSLDSLYSRCAKSGEHEWCSFAYNSRNGEQNSCHNSSKSCRYEYFERNGVGVNYLMASPASLSSCGSIRSDSSVERIIIGNIMIANEIAPQMQNTSSCWYNYPEICYDTDNNWWHLPCNSSAITGWRRHFCVRGILKAKYHTTVPRVLQ